jgi:DNA primase
MRTKILSDDKFTITPGMVINAFEALEIPYNASDKEAVVACPFHDDSGKPHCYVNVRERAGIFHCFKNGCEARGDFLEFLVGSQKWNAYKAIAFCRALRHSAGDEAPVRLEPAHKQHDEDPLAKYAYRHAYLSERGLSEDTLQRFDIGYDREKAAIVFPWFDKQGNLVAIKKRRVLDKYYDYEQGADLSHTLFGLHLAKSYGFLWITEAEIDAMTLDQVFRLGHFDKHFALALGGKEIRESQIEATLSRRPVAVVLMLDTDEEGRKAQKNVKDKLAGRIRVYEAEFPAGDAKDANDLNYEQIVKITLTIANKEEERTNARIQRRESTP